MDQRLFNRIRLTIDVYRDGLPLVRGLSDKELTTAWEEARAAGMEVPVMDGAYVDLTKNVFTVEAMLRRRRERKDQEEKKG